MNEIRRLSFAAPIWKTALDEEKGWLGLEIRDADSLQAEFAVVNLEKGSLTSTGLRLPERWWISLEGAQQGVLKVSQFQPSIESSRQAKHWIIDAETSKATLLEPNGEVRKNTFSEERETLEISAAGNALAVPFHYQPESEHYPTLLTFLEQKLEVEPVGPIEYLEVEDRLLFSYNLRKGEVFANYFVNFGSDGTPAAAVCLESDLTGFGKDTFMVWQHKLVLCIQQHKTLLMIDLK